MRGDKVPGKFKPRPGQPRRRPKPGRGPAWALFLFQYSLASRSAIAAGFFVITICLTGRTNHINNKVLKYEWDEPKNIENVAKHGVGFEAAEGFDWTAALVAEDTRRDYGEQRFRAISFIGSRLHVMVYTAHGDSVRIISLRKANAREVKSYA